MGTFTITYQVNKTPIPIPDGMEAMLCKTHKRLPSLFALKTKKGKEQGVTACCDSPDCECYAWNVKDVIEKWNRFQIPTSI